MAAGLTDPHDRVRLFEPHVWFLCEEPERPFDLNTGFVAECAGCVRAARVITAAGFDEGVAKAAHWEDRVILQTLTDWADMAEKRYHADA